MTTVDIAWLAGILEGEGCFQRKDSPSISLAMSDEDVVRKVASLFKRPVNTKKKEFSYHKTQFIVTIHGTAAIEWMFTIYSLMGWRRRRAIIEAIELWKNQHSSFNRETFKCGHSKVSTNTYRGRGDYIICRTCAIARSIRYKKEKQA